MPPIRILLVEDDAAYAALLTAEIEEAVEAAVVISAVSLHAAEAALAQSRFDAILLDLGLPDSQGVETVGRMNALALGVPIIVVTAHDDEQLALESLQRGAEDYLVKGHAGSQGLRRSIQHARERVSLRRALFEREARFRALVEHSLDAITLVDADFVSLYNSRSIERVSGYSPEELNGQPLNSFTHPDDLPEAMGAMAECVANPGRPVTLSYRYRHKDGTWHWGEAVAVNRLDDPAVRAIVVNHRDISERKLAEQALRASQEKLRQAHKMEAVGRLAGGIAHDFNNVLTAIFGYADLLLDQFSIDDPRRSDIEEIRRSAERAATLTRQLLAFSRKQVMRPRLLDLNSVVTGMEKLLNRLIGGDIVMNVRLEPEPWQVLADPGQIEQVLMNLAANARDAMPDGGQLNVATANVELSAAQVEALPGLAAGSYAALDVSDTGQGIPADAQAHIFEPFFTTKEQGKGTGLGLATVYGIVKQTGGGVYLTDNGEKGTRFVVYLPRVP